MEAPRPSHPELALDLTPTSKIEQTHKDPLLPHGPSQKTLSPEVKQPLYDTQPIDHFNFHSAPQITSSDLLTICQSQPIHFLETLMLQHSKAYKSQLCEIDLLSKINKSSLPKRVIQWLVKQIENYLKERYNPEDSEICYIRLRNKGVLIGHILYQIFELKHSVGLAGNESDQLIASLKQDQALKVSIQISGQIENKIYLLFQIRDEPTKNEQIYKRIFQKLISSIVKMGGESFIKEFVCPFLYFPRIDQVDGEFYLKNVSLSSTVENLITKLELINETEKSGNQLTSQKSQQLKKHFEKYEDSKLNLKHEERQLEQLCNQLTSCDQSSGKSSKEAEILLEKQSKFTNSIIYEAGQDNQQNDNQKSTQQKKDENLHLQPIVENNLIENEEINQLQNMENVEEENLPNTPQLQALYSTMDTSQPSQLVLEVEQNQPPIAEIVIVVQNLQESNETHQNEKPKMNVINQQQVHDLRQQNHNHSELSAPENQKQETEINICEKNQTEVNHKGQEAQKFKPSQEQN